MKNPFLFVTAFLLVSFLCTGLVINKSWSEKSSKLAQVYHFGQDNAGVPAKIFNPTTPTQINGFQAIVWRTRLKFVTAQNNYVEATVNSYCSEADNAPSGVSTVQFQKNWGGTNRSAGINAWNSAVYGNNAKVSFGAMISIPFFSPPYNTTLYPNPTPCAYADFYLRGYDMVSQKSYWLQYSFFDNRGGPGTDVINLDPFTQEWMLEGHFKTNSQYMSIIPSSNSFTSNAFLPPLKFFGGSISRAQIVYTLTQLKTKIGGNFSTNPDDHRIFAFGCTPEIANAQTGASINFRMNNMFLRTDY